MQSHTTIPPLPQNDTHLQLAKTYREQFQYAQAEEELKKAVALQPDRALPDLITLYKLQGRFEEAKKLLIKHLNNTQATEISAEETTGLAKRKYLDSSLKDINTLSITQQFNLWANPPNRSTKRIIYFDLDNTLINAKAYYDLNAEEKEKYKDRLSEFFTAPVEKWMQVFTQLQKLGFTLGICSFRKSPSGYDEMYKTFMQQFGDYFSAEHILFTNKANKGPILLNQCARHGINFENALIVDDNLSVIVDCTAHRISGILVETLATQPESFELFKVHLLERAQMIVDASEPAVKAPGEQGVFGAPLALDRKTKRVKKLSSDQDHSHQDRPHH